MARIGRPPLLTPAIQAAIVQSLTYGSFLSHAAELVGVHRLTVNHWRKRGEAEYNRLQENQDAEPNEEEAKYLDFYNAVMRARSKAVDDALIVIKTAAVNGDAKSAQWFLERSHPHEWGFKQKIQHSGDDENPVSVSADVRIISYADTEAAAEVDRLRLVADNSRGEQK